MARTIRRINLVCSMRVQYDSKIHGTSVTLTFGAPNGKFSLSKLELALIAFKLEMEHYNYKFTKQVLVNVFKYVSLGYSSSCLHKIISNTLPDIQEIVLNPYYCKQHTKNAQDT